MALSLKIEGMTCSHCVEAVRRALAAVPGVTRVLEVDRERGTASVEGEPRMADLIAAVEEEGYTARAA
ncbi:MAG: heavy-metal-associated domain-containing protein [Gammaproteobacteria bacterium]|jgi:copper chaperone|nr:heavy-metal-associated domain-containing protein [Gammaproteobacteria bacterium]